MKTIDGVGDHEVLIFEAADDDEATTCCCTGGRAS